MQRGSTDGNPGTAGAHALPGLGFPSWIRSPFPRIHDTGPPIILPRLHQPATNGIVEDVLALRHELRFSARDPVVEVALPQSPVHTMLPGNLRSSVALEVADQPRQVPRRRAFGSPKHCLRPTWN